MPSKTNQKHHVIILGAGRSVRGNVPSVVRVMDWLVTAFQTLPRARFSLVSGFNANFLIEQFPDAEIFFNPQWESTGPVFSLSLVPLEIKSPTYISYADIVFRPSLVQQMENQTTDVVLAVDSRWRNRYQGRATSALLKAERISFKRKGSPFLDPNSAPDEADAEFTGLVRFSPKAVARIKNLLKLKTSSLSTTLPQLIDQLILSGLSWSTVDSQGDWAALDAAQDLARFVLGTKAESLQRLKPLVRASLIPESVSFTAKDWKKNPTKVVKEIRSAFSFGNLIVRSSALNEDSWKQSLAGKNLSVASVPSRDTGKIEKAIELVLASYDDLALDDQVLVQPMLENVRCSGVVLTRAQDGRAPYYVISYDDTTASTSSVTSGNGAHIKTLYLLRDTRFSDDFPKPLCDVIEGVKEIENLVGHDSLDIEFAITDDERLWLLQVRPLTAGKEIRSLEDNQIRGAINLASRWFSGYQTAHPSLLGKKTILNVMSDWNPAEIIGTKPKPLAFSLYRHVITDETWATQRAEFGYRDVRPCPLIVSVLGHPYVDVRATFNSFVPAALSQQLSQKLVEHYLLHLRVEPELYDKVEFEILFTCLAFDFDHTSKRLTDSGFTVQETTQFRAALRDLTEKGITRCASDFAAIPELAARQARARDSALPPLAMAFLLLEDIRRLSALNFAHLARQGFIAMTLLRSLEKVEAITANEKEAFLASLITVSGQMRTDAWLVKESKKTRAEFIATYGHLRPGTYDITSSRYDVDPSRFLEPLVEEAVAPSTIETFVWNAKTADKIAMALEKARLPFTPQFLANYFKQAIEGRELSKFQFTKGLSDALEMIAQWGQSLGFSREELSHVSISQLLSLREPISAQPAEVVKAMLTRGRAKQELLHSLCLPTQIFSNDDFFGHKQMTAEANFITRQRVCANGVHYERLGEAQQDLRGHIILIPSADPGYDWILGQGISGLITMYGGTNSHMAIRAAECRLPAAIGVGEVLFLELTHARLIDLDCANRRVAAVSTETTKQKKAA